MTPTPDSQTAPSRTRRVYMEEFGCQMNRNDAELVSGRLIRDGYVQTPTLEDADVILYYTCSVREKAEDKVLSRLGTLKRLKAEKPGTVIGVMGCMAQRMKEEIFSRAPHVDLVVGTSQFENVTTYIDELEQNERVVATDLAEVDYSRDVSLRPHRFQAFVTVMRGCDKFCTFCIVPFTQGRETSRGPEEIEDEVRRLVDDGVKHVTLLGQRVNTYGLDLNRGEMLATLLQRLEKVRGLERLQFITSHPTHIDETLMRVIRDHEVHSRYLHLPVQSGSDRVLKAMNRGHDVDSYRRTMDMVKRIVPDMGLATDWIVGFPTETEADFEQSLNLQRDIGFQGSFIFKYSVRSGTKAAKAIPDEIPTAVKEERNQRLLAQQAEISERLNRSRIGEEHLVLVEGISKRDDTRWVGRTTHNWIVVFRAGRDLSGEFVKVKITAATNLTLFGELV